MPELKLFQLQVFFTEKETSLKRHGINLPSLKSRSLLHFLQLPPLPPITGQNSPFSIFIIRIKRTSKPFFSNLQHIQPEEFRLLS